jgi:hypothetical protein
MSSTIPFHGNNMLPDVVIPVPVAGSRKRKPAFSMNDPDNVELARLATQAAKKKTKLSMVNSSGKDFEKTHQKKPAGLKSNRQLSNFKDVNESEAGDDNSEPEAEATKKKGLSKPTPSQNKKNRKKNKPVPKQQNRQPLVEDMDDLTDSNRENVANTINDSESDDDDIQIVEEPTESAEEELS